MEWISVKDAMPGIGERVLGYGRAECGTCCEDKMVRECRRHYKNQCFEFGEYDCPFNITHWMPLPEPPRECQ